MEILGQTVEELEAVAGELGHPTYRARQVFEWLHKHNAESYADMANVPKGLRADLAERYGRVVPEVRERLECEDATKLLLGMADGERVEAVRMGRPWGETACLSSQVGCPVGCAFCASAHGGFARNLTAGEMVAQLGALRRLGDPMKRAVFMGMGEPLLNLDNVIRAIGVLGDKRGLGLPERAITISTVGITQGIEALRESGLRVRLTVSLHATEDRAREGIIPNWCEPIAEVLEAGSRYAQATRRRLTIAYVLMHGFNDRRADARRLAQMAKRAGALVNVIGFNEVPGVEFDRPSLAASEGFVRTLVESGIRASLRRSVGREAEAACGQLRRRG